MIKNIGQMNSTLKQYDSKGWTKSVELGKQFNITESPNSQGKIEGTSFGDMLLESMARVNNLQHKADKAMQEVASGKSNNLHETILAVEKADIAFKTMNQVRMKVIDAYKEIMKMQV